MTSAVFTLLYDLNYLPGALLLGTLIKELLPSSDIKLGILIDKLVFSSDQLNLLSAIYDDLVEVPILKSKFSHKLNHELNRPELDKTFTKVHLWSLYHKYTKILYLDSDTLPNVTAKKTSIVDLLKLEFPANKIVAAPDSGFPDIFNSGVFVMKPNEGDYNSLVEVLQHEDITFDGADQGLLNQFFNHLPDWVNDLVTNGEYNVFSIEPIRSSNWIPLPFLYNVTPSSQYQYYPAYNYFSNTPIMPFGKGKGLPTMTGDQSYGYTGSKYYTQEEDQVKLVHFIGPFKPWNYPSSGGIHLKWWGLWNKYFGNDEFTNNLAFSRSFQYEQTIEPEINYSSMEPSMKPSMKPTIEPTMEQSTSKSELHYNDPESNTNSLKTKPIDPIEQQKQEKHSKFGFHWFQKPERSFSVDNDYTPTHPAITKLKEKEVEQVSEKVNKLRME